MALEPAISAHAHQAEGPQTATTIRLCTSLPTHVPPLQALTTGINNSVILATERWKARFRRAHLHLLAPLLLSDAAPDGSSFQPEREASSAKFCVSRLDVLGFVGPLNSGAAISSEPILNRAGLVQISPANTSPALTSPVLRSRLEPATYHHRLRYLTYYRDIATDALQGPSDAAFLKERVHAQTFFAVTDPFSYGFGLSGAMKAYASKIGLQIVGSAEMDPSNLAASSDTISDAILAAHPEAVFFGGDGSTALPLIQTLRQMRYKGPIVGGDALIRPDVLRANGGSRNLFASNLGPNPRPASLRRLYNKRFRIPLEYYNATAYDAANIVLHGIYMAAVNGRLRGNLFDKRVAVLSYVRNVHWHGVTGTTTFDRNGDTRNQLVSVYGSRQGKWAYLGTAPRVTGVAPTG